MRTKLNLKAFLLLWYWFFLLGLIALAFQRLGQCGHISSTFGKYFEAKVVEKHEKFFRHILHTLAPFSPTYYYLADRLTSDTTSTYAVRILYLAERWTDLTAECCVMKHNTQRSAVKSQEQRTISLATMSAAVNRRHFALLFAKNGLVPPGSRKKLKKFAWNFYSEP